jgi:hypothetical protein
MLVKLSRLLMRVKDGYALKLSTLLQSWRISQPLKVALEQEVFLLFSGTWLTRGENLK